MQYHISVIQKGKEVFRLVLHLSRINCINPHVAKEIWFFLPLWGFPCSVFLTTAILLYLDFIFTLHQLAEQVWPLMSPLQPLHSCNLFSFSLSCFTTYPLRIIPFPACPHPLPVSSSACISFTSFPFDFFLFTADLHTPLAAAASLLKVQN